jgi:hypothetical protein
MVLKLLGINSNKKIVLEDPDEVEGINAEFAKLIKNPLIIIFMDVEMVMSFMYRDLQLNLNISQILLL